MFSNKGKFVQATHNFGDKYVHGLLVYLSNLETGNCPVLKCDSKKKVRFFVHLHSQQRLFYHENCISTPNYL